jgi:gamma-glutamylcyclotransferase (GGCT)/AIG2-like uncharacterized protein YtfP
MLFEIDGMDEREIVGEVYRIDHDTLDCLDVLEGHPQWYRRHQVDTPFKKAWAYFMQDEVRAEDLSACDNGVWNPTEDELQWLDKS